MYLLHHEEIESLAKTIPGVKRIRFFMTFGQSYLDHMRCLEDVGMLSTTPIQYNSGSCKPWTTYKRKNKYWMYLCWCKRRKRKNILYLQCM